MSFSPAQMRVMRALDGRWSPLELDGTYWRTLKSLAEGGWISFTRQNLPKRPLFVVTLTRQGADFIYNGGIDQ